MEAENYKISNGVNTKKQEVKKLLWLEIKNGDDLTDSITEYCQANNIKAGLVHAVGALKNAKFSFYDQAEKKYLVEEINRPVELLSYLGNISLKDEKIFIHAHIAVSDKTGKVYGGHLEKDSIVFACECAILEASGELLRRKFDGLTGLNLWDFSK